MKIGAALDPIRVVIGSGHARRISRRDRTTFVVGNIRHFFARSAHDIGGTDIARCAATGRIVGFLVFSRGFPPSHFRHRTPHSTIEQEAYPGGGRPETCRAPGEGARPCKRYRLARRFAAFFLERLAALFRVARPADRAAALRAGFFAAFFFAAFFALAFRFAGFAALALAVFFGAAATRAAGLATGFATFFGAAGADAAPSSEDG